MRMGLTPQRLVARGGGGAGFGSQRLDETPGMKGLLVMGSEVVGLNVVAMVGVEEKDECPN